MRILSDTIQIDKTVTCFVFFKFIVRGDQEIFKGGRGRSVLKCVAENLAENAPPPPPTPHLPKSAHEATVIFIDSESMFTSQYITVRLDHFIISLQRWGPEDGRPCLNSPKLLSCGEPSKVFSKRQRGWKTFLVFIRISLHGINWSHINQPTVDIIDLYRYIPM